MAPGSLSTQPQELVLFKDVAVDFTHEEWSLLEPGQKELYKTVMLENAWNLLCVGLPVTKQDVMSYFEQKEAPWKLQEEDLRTFFPGSQDSERMAPGSFSTQCQELVLFKEVAVDFTQEEWSLLELHQELYKTVMLENAWNLLSVGLPVTKQDVICYFEQKGAPWMLQEEDLRTCCPEEEIRLEMKETTGTLNLFVEETEKQGVLNDSPCDFTGSEFYAAHEKIPTREKLHECKLCGKSFLWTGRLPAHQRVHPGLKPYECIPCGKAFICQSRLTTHERIHTGEKLFECNDCGKAFTREPSLKAHQRIHPGEKLYKW